MSLIPHRISLIVGLVCAGLSGLSAQSFTAPLPSADEFVALAKRANRATLVYFRPPRRTVEITEPSWFEFLSGLVDKTTYEPREHCFCMVDPLLELFENEKLLLRITIHHGNRIRFNPASGTGGDFLIGDEAGRSFITLIVGEPLPPMEPPSVSEPTWSPQHVPPIAPPAFELNLDLDVLSRF